MVNMANPETLEEAYNIAKRWELSTIFSLGGDPHSVYNQPGMDGYGRDYYPRRVLNPQPLAVRPPLTMKETRPLAITAPIEDVNSKEITELQQKFKELSVQLANARDKRLY
jgi:hypothetical protein